MFDTKTEYLKINVRTGHLVRQIDAITKGLQVMRDELAKIEDTYCETHGDELVHVRYEKGYEVKGCPRCSYMIAVMDKYARV